VQKLLELLLAKFSGEYSIEENTSAAILKIKDAATAEKICAHLQVSLRSTHEFYNSFAVKVKTEHSTIPSKPASTDTETVSLPENNIESVKKVFENIFGQAFSDAGFDPNLFFGEGAKIKDGVLFSKPAKSIGIEKTWRSLFDWLSLYFKDVELDALRAAWTGIKSLPAPSEESFETLKSNYIHGLVQQCFGIQKIDKTTIGYFNFQRLYQFIFAPVLVVMHKDNAYFIEIDKSHFLTYVEQLKEDGVLLRIFRPTRDHQPVIQPMFIGLKETVELPPLYILVIDRSYSIKHHFDGLKKHIQSFIDKLRQLKPDAKLRITFFDDSIDPAKEFNIQDSYAISTFLANISTGWSTNLFGALHQETQYANSQASTHAVALMLFTDGVDNVNDDIKKQSFRESLTTEAEKSKAPKFYAYGYGSYDQETLSSLAITLQGSFVHLQSFEQLDSAFNLASRKKESRILVNLKLLLNSEESQSYRVPLYADGSIQSPAIFIPFAESSMKLEIQGKSIVVTIPDNTAIPAATNLDTIGLLVAKARQCVADPEMNVEQKIKMLDDFLRQLEALPVQTIAETEGKVCAADELKDYKTTISLAKDDATLRSIYTKARIRTHFIETTNTFTEPSALCSATDHSNWNQALSSGPVSTANGVETLPLLETQVQASHSVSTQDNSTAQHAAPFQLMSGYSTQRSPTFPAAAKNSERVETVPESESVALPPRQ